MARTAVHVRAATAIRRAQWDGCDELAEHAPFVLSRLGPPIGDLLDGDSMPVDVGLLQCGHWVAGFGPGLFRLDPADQVLPAHPFQQRRMVRGQVPPDHPDYLVIAIAAGHEPAFASDQLHFAPPALAVLPA